MSARLREDGVRVLNYRPTSAGKSEELDEDMQAAERLLVLWNECYTKMFGIHYQDGTNRHEKLMSLAGLIGVCGSEEKAAKAVKAMFTPELGWVNNISIGWLCRERNLARFVMPVVGKAQRKKSVDWKKERQTGGRVVTMKKRRT